MKLPELFGFKRWKKRTRVMASAAVTLLVTGGVAAWVLLANNSPANAQAAAVSTSPAYQTTVARRGDLKVSISGAGVLDAGKSVDLGFSTRGTVVELDVSLGDVVRQGDTLAKLGDTQALDATLASARLACLQAKQALTALQNEAGVSLAQAYSDWVSAKKSFEEARTAYARTSYARCSQDVNAKNAEKLANAKDRLAGITPGADGYAEARSALETAQANYDYCIAYTSDEKTEARAAMDLADTQMQQAEAKCERLKAGSGIDPDDLAIAEAKVNQAETAYAQAQKDLEGATLVAPITGKVTYLAADVGEIVGTDKFITISDLSAPTLEISVDEADLNQFAVGNTVYAVFDALPNKVFTGKVVRIDPELSASFETTTAAGWVELNTDAAEALQSYPLGLGATLEIVQNEVAGAVLVPVEAVHDLGDGQYGVFIREANGKLRLRVVEVGMRSDSYAEIKSGINAGDVVTTGLVSTSNS